MLFWTWGVVPFSDNGTNPRRKCRCRGENDEKFQQLAFQVESVLPAIEYALHLGIEMLEEPESAKKEPVDEYHVISFVDSKYDQKPLKNSANVNPSLNPSQIEITPTPTIVRILMTINTQPIFLAP